jgi:hypothetical protein
MHLSAGGSRCPICESPFTEGSARCDFCGGKLQSRHRPLLPTLLWLLKAYRTWSLGLFAYALYHLLRIGAFESYFALLCVVVPFGMALALSYRMGESTPLWIVSFLLLVDVGIVIAPEHQLLPMLNLFPQLPRTQNRILTWYFLVYGSLQFVVAPPVMFFRSLRTAWRGKKAALAPWICLLGFAVCGLIVAILVMLALHA